MKKTYREGEPGALLDEYERATEELKNLIAELSEPNYKAIADSVTKDADCVSIQTIMNHVVRAGYGYANYIRKQFGDKLVERNENYEVSTPTAACLQLDAMLAYTADTLSNKSELKYDELSKNIMKVSWGINYDVEQLLEHAIVHILRHRRQIEKFIIVLQKK